MNNLALVLASTSPFRQEILDKLHIPYTAVAPDCDETAQPNEGARQLVVRLAEEKAKSCVLAEPSLVIGSDQVCVVNDEIIGKPLSQENAVKQLKQQSGQTITFYTGLALYNTETGQCDSSLDTFTVHFRHLSDEQITRYVEKEQPLYCAGSFKCEGLGIALFEKLEGKDPNTLIGLPLIDLIDLLAKHNYHVL